MTRTKFDVLDSVGASGAIEGLVWAKIALAYEMFENFRAGRELRFGGVGEIDAVSWLYKKHKETLMMGSPRRVPFGDHFRLFTDRATGQRIVTIQPYWGRVAREDLRIEFSKEFRDLDIHWNREVGLRDERFKRRPDIPEVRDGFAALLNAAQQKSDEFADKYGLVAKVSFNGWYYPERTILIEYTRK